MLHVNPHLLSVLSGVILPLLVAFVTKKHASPGVKAATLTVLAVASAVGAVLLAGHGAITVNKLVDTAGAAFASSVVLYYGIYKPAGWTDVIQNLSHDFGIGTDPYAVVTSKVEQIMTEAGYVLDVNGNWTHPGYTAAGVQNAAWFAPTVTTGVAPSPPVPPIPVEQSEPPAEPPVDPVVAPTTVTLNPDEQSESPVGQ